MRFTAVRDYNTILSINKELVNDVVDVKVVLYKIHQELTRTNSYGEAANKIWYVGTEIPCLIDRQEQIADTQTGAVDVSQAISFAFLRKECEERDVYPEIGDYINWDGRYYELDSFTESQLFAGRTEYTHSIVLKGHLTRKTGLQLESPQR